MFESHKILFCTPSNITSIFRSGYHGAALDKQSDFCNIILKRTWRPATETINSKLMRFATKASQGSDNEIQSRSAALKGRLSALRDEMRQREVDAFIVPSTDPHNSEYPAPCFERRAYISGFDGSAGTAIVTLDRAFLWTDGRYFLQAERQLDGEHWQLMRMGLPETPTISVFLATQLPSGSTIGIDPLLHSVESTESYIKTLESAGSSLTMLSAPNPVDVVWGDERPSPPNGVVRPHEVRYAGVSVADKLKMLRDSMKECGAHALLLSMLDETAWLYNVRGDDVPHCPVVLSYALVTTDRASFYVDGRKLNDAAREALDRGCVSVRPYDAVLNDVEDAAKNGKVWFDPTSTSAAVALAAGDSSVKNQTPVPLAKAIKNSAELSGMRAAHVRDGVALSSFLCWLENHVCGGNAITEVEAANKLESFRAAQKGFLSTSFSTIAGAGANGSIIHYSPTPEACANVTDREIFLLDSGGQYVDGTTDVTRTMHFGGTATDFERSCFTRVLKGHINLDKATFPEGTTGLMIDALARTSLWSAGLDYRHGTGHGVGACLNVHEGPQSISSRPGSNKAILKAGMIVSNEPGYYEDGQFGIRTENLLAITKVNTEFSFGGREYLGFERLTFVPIDQSMIMSELLTKDEVCWLNGYHEEVWQKLSPHVKDDNVHDWLWKKTRPLKQDSLVNK